MDLPNHLRAMPPSAVDVIRYLSKLEMRMAGIDDICEEVGLSERGFGKAIRSLVTKGYVVMDGDQIYRLTDQGSAVAEELAEYDGDGDDVKDEYDVMEDAEAEAEPLTRRLVLVMPEHLAANQPALVVVGFAPLDDQTTPLEIVTRLSAINAEPSAPQETSFHLGSGPARQDFLITPGPFSQVRVKVEVYQLGPNPDDISSAGGMYVDVPVDAGEDAAQTVAYGADITLQPQD